MLENIHEAKVYQLTGSAEDWITTYLKGFWGLRTDQMYQWMAINEGDYCLFHAEKPEWAEVTDPEPLEGIIGIGKVEKKTDDASLEWIREIQAHVIGRSLLIHFSEVSWLGDVDKVASEEIKEKLAKGDAYIADEVRALTENAITLKELESKGVSYSPAKSVSEVKNGKELLLKLVTARIGTSRYGADWSQMESYFAVWTYDQLDQIRTMDKAGLFREVAGIIGRKPEALVRKVQNVSFHDPRPQKEKPILEATNAQALLERIFNWYWQNREAARAHYGAMYQAAAFMVDMPVVQDGSEKTKPREIIVEEGAPGYEYSARNKRAAELLRQGQMHFSSRDAEKKLRCGVCNFAAPDEVGDKIVQLHHIKLIGDVDENGKEMTQKEALKRMAPLCPTCHVLAHTNKPPLSVDEMKSLRGIDQK